MIINYKNSYFDKVLIQRQLPYCLFHGTLQAPSKTETIAEHQSELHIRITFRKSYLAISMLAVGLHFKVLKLLWQFWAVKQLLALWYVMLLCTLN